jgi:hypothetical protein
MTSVCSPAKAGIQILFVGWTPAFAGEQARP